jgi:5-methyltetrahydrofolate--homocysteine methyltransferase
MMPTDFTIIGENIHCTRVVKRGGVRGHVFEDGTEAVKYRVGGEPNFVRVPKHFEATQPYQQGNLKHFMIAIWKGVNREGAEAAEGKNYIKYEVDRQTRAGASYLDLNVDELSHRIEEQIEAMQWLVRYVQSVAEIPPSIDSSNSEIIQSGLEAYDGSAGRPMVNSVALERLDTLDLIAEHNAKCIISAASESGMPDNSDERLENATRVVDAASDRNIEFDDIYIDPLFFPVSVDKAYGPHALEAISKLRKRFGEEVHITGGMSNVSFGLPKRALVNETFVKLAVEAGADSGIIDPIQVKVERALMLDMDAPRVRYAVDLLQGRDDFAMNYISAYRNGELD